MVKREDRDTDRPACKYTHTHTHIYYSRVCAKWYERCRYGVRHSRPGVWAA